MAAETDLRIQESGNQSLPAAAGIQEKRKV
jgi:hypothetical protein